MVVKDGIFLAIESNFDDVVIVNTLGAKVVTEKLEKQVCFPAATNARNYLNHAVVHAVYKPIEYRSRLISMPVPIRLTIGSI